jgi:hypothetical protein
MSIAAPSFDNYECNTDSKSKGRATVDYLFRYFSDVEFSGAKRHGRKAFNFLVQVLLYSIYGRFYCHLQILTRRIVHAAPQDFSVSCVRVQSHECSSVGRFEI